MWIELMVIESCIVTIIMTTYSGSSQWQLRFTASTATSSPSSSNII